MIISPKCTSIRKVRINERIIHTNSEAPAARRAAKWSPITIGTGSHACIEIETHATLFSW